jgi:hypothetical protein
VGGTTENALKGFSQKEKDEVDIRCLHGEPIFTRAAHTPSCAPALRWRQGQALRVMRNLDAAGRGRSIDRAGSEGMPLPYLTKGIALASQTTRENFDSLPPVIS